jgi:hypothetical protein
VARQSIDSEPERAVLTGCDGSGPTIPDTNAPPVEATHCAYRDPDAARQQQRHAQALFQIVYALFEIGGRIDEMIDIASRTRLHSFRLCMIRTGEVLLQLASQRHWQTFQNVLNRWRHSLPRQ